MHCNLRAARCQASASKLRPFDVIQITTRKNGSTDVCSKVMPVKSIYLLNVVVKQESLTKT